MKVRIEDDKRGLFFKNGNYIKTLQPGEYSVWNFLKEKVVVLDVNFPLVVPGKNLQLFLKDENLVKELSILDLKDYEIALHYEDGRLADLMKPGLYAWWNSLKKHEFKVIDIRIPEIPDSIDTSQFNSPKMNGSFFIHEIAQYETGLLFFNGVYQKILNAGKYYYWNGTATVSVLKADMRQLQMDIAGQEIMTEDKVTLRLNFVCQYRIIDPVKALVEIKSYSDQIYILLQMVLREYVGGIKLDELLLKKQEIGNFVLEKLKEKSREFGIEFLNAGVKDIILPGEIKEILNTVLIAEKKAQANIITRREETASTRSLLNTARLMDENTTLFRLKELEYLEKICDKIGNITLMGGGGLLQNLTAVLTENTAKSKDLKS